MVSASIWMKSKRRFVVRFGPHRESARPQMQRQRSDDGNITGPDRANDPSRESKKGWMEWREQYSSFALIARPLFRNDSRRCFRASSPFWEANGINRGR